MRHRKRLALGIVAGVCLLGMVSGSAAANRLLLSNQAIRIVYPTYTSNDGGRRISCALTLEGSFHSRTITKVRSSLIGYITRALVTHPCAGGWGDMTFLSETLPWHVQYLSFSGTLPTIREITVDVIGFSWDYPEVGGMGQCLYRSTAAGPARFNLNREAGGVVTSAGADPGPAVPKARGGVLCAESINYSGIGSITLLGATTAITVRLI